MTSAISRMLECLELTNPECAMSKHEVAILEWIRNYDVAQTAEYQKNKDVGLITFGKYRNQSVKAVAGLDKGIEYLGWVSRQTWFSVEKFPVLYPKLIKAIKKT